MSCMDWQKASVSSGHKLRLLLNELYFLASCELQSCKHVSSLEVNIYRAVKDGRRWEKEGWMDGKDFDAN